MIARPVQRFHHSRVSNLTYAATRMANSVVSGWPSRDLFLLDSEIESQNTVLIVEHCCPEIRLAGGTPLNCGEE